MSEVKMFLFRYQERATANVKPVHTVSCEGTIYSDGYVTLRDIDSKQCYNFERLSNMFDHFSKHGKGTIRPLPVKTVDEVEEEE